MTNALFVCLQVYTNCVMAAGCMRCSPAGDWRVFELHPQYSHRLVRKCDYCRSVEERDRRGWLVHIVGHCTCETVPVLDRYELVPADGREILQ